MYVWHVLTQSHSASIHLIINDLSLPYYLIPDGCRFIVHGNKVNLLCPKRISYPGP